MLILAMNGFLIGVVLGLRFKMLVLVPTIGLVLAMVATTGAGTWQLVGTMIVVATSLQLGYLGGGILQFSVFAKRAADHRGTSMPAISTEVSSPGQSRNRGGMSSRFETGKQLRQA